jgi:hypothetical protein
VDLERNRMWRTRWDSSGLGLGTIIGSCKCFEFYKNLENGLTEMMVILTLMLKFSGQGLLS